MNWDEYYLRIANVVREKSKDPNTTVGAVIVGHAHEIISTGYNGFPRGILDSASRWERPAKYDYVVHAEHNAILNAARNGTRLEGSTLYLVGMGPPTAPCRDCAKAIIQAGVGRVVGSAYKPVPTETRHVWQASIEQALDFLNEAGVRFEEVLCGF